MSVVGWRYVVDGVEPDNETSVLEEGFVVVTPDPLPCRAATCSISYGCLLDIDLLLDGNSC